VSGERLIAVIDDDDSFRIALRESLCSLGYDAHGFASAEEFLAGGGAEPYDCVITDIHMPRMSGFDLKRELVAHDVSVPVIMTTADDEPELEAGAAAVGAVSLLRKPFEAEILTECLERAWKI
jgi:FixJ family two-component response regulator